MAGRKERGEGGERERKMNKEEKRKEKKTTFIFGLLLRRRLSDI